MIYRFVGEKIADRPSVVHSGRSFFFVTPPVCCLNIVRVIVSPGSTHSFRIPMIWDHVVIVGEFFMADGANATLLPDLPAQEFAHLRRRPKFAVAPRMMLIFNPLNSKSD